MRWGQLDGSNGCQFTLTGSLSPSQAMQPPAVDPFALEAVIFRHWMQRHLWGTMAACAAVPDSEYTRLATLPFPQVRPFCARSG